VGALDFSTGVFTPIITGLGSPRGLAILSQKELKVRNGDDGDGHDEAHIAASVNHDDLAAVLAVSRLAGTGTPQINRDERDSVHISANGHPTNIFIVYNSTRVHSWSHAISGAEMSGHNKAKVETQGAFASLATDLDDF
jgi:hypothetical protein